MASDGDWSTLSIDIKYDEYGSILCKQLYVIIIIIIISSSEYNKMLIP